MKILNKESIDSFNFFGDGVMDKVLSIVASTFDGDLNLINEVIENKKVDSYTREMLLKTYIYFYENKIVSQEVLEAYLRKLIKLYNYEEDEIYNRIPLVVSSTHLFGMIKDVKELFDNELVELEINGDYDTFIDDIFNYERQDKISPFEDIVKEMSWWHCFSNKQEKDIDVKKMTNELEEMVKKEMQSGTAAYSKVGRNDPCPCGSGKKYKNCCLRG